MSGAPRWIPDWSRNQLPLENAVSFNNVVSEVLYCASGKFLNEVVSSALAAVPTHLQVCGAKVVSVGSIIKTIDRRTWRAGLNRPWSKSCASDQYALNDMSLDEVLERTVVADAYYPSTEFLTKGIASRGIKCIGIDQVGLLSPEKYELYHEAVVRALTDRRLFCTDQDHKKGLLGLGPKNGHSGNEVWMLKGSSVLHVLRPVLVDATCSHSTFDVTGDQSGLRDYWKGTVVYEYVGDCFMVGLMDGEVLDMMGEEPKRPRPAPLEDMDREFRVITLV